MLQPYIESATTLSDIIITSFFCNDIEQIHQCNLSCFILLQVDQFEQADTVYTLIPSDG